MSKIVRSGSMAVLCLAILSLTGCMAFGYGIFSKADVTDIHWTYGYNTWLRTYSVKIEYKVTNSGMTHIGTCHITFKVTSKDGSVFKDIGIAENLEPGDTTTSSTWITVSSSPVTDVKVVDVQRFTI
jgi:hypothetical protein